MATQGIFMSEVFKNDQPVATGKLKGFYIFDGPEELFRTAARVLLELCLGEIARKGYFTVVLSGGSTPLGLYSLLASAEFRERVAWKDIHFFWGDERCAPPDDELSNYGAAMREMFSKVDVPEGNIHRMRGEAPPSEAALEYEREIKDFFRERGAAAPSFDMVFLGLGEDGHTLSLFPGSGALTERERLVVESLAGDDGPVRLTMTLPLVNTAGVCAFLVSGKGKSRILRAVMEDESVRYPAGMVAPRSGNLVWFVDKGAASIISGIPGVLGPSRRAGG